MLVTVVVLTALVPTLIAQAVFYPRSSSLRYGAEDPADMELEPVREGGS